MLPTITTWPSPERSRAGRNARVTRAVPRTFSSYIRRHASRSASATGSRPNAPPALFTSRRTSGTLATNASTEAGSVTSRATARATPPSAPTAAAPRSRRALPPAPPPPPGQGGGREPAPPPPRSGDPARTPAPSPPPGPRRAPVWRAVRTAGPGEARRYGDPSGSPVLPLLRNPLVRLRPRPFADRLPELPERPGQQPGDGQPGGPP